MSEEQRDELAVRREEAIAQQEQARTRRTEIKAKFGASRWYAITLVVVIIVTLLSLAGTVAIGLLLAEPTQEQQETRELLQSVALSGFSGLVGLLAGKFA